MSLIYYNEDGWGFPDPRDWPVLDLLDVNDALIALIHLGVIVLLRACDADGSGSTIGLYVDCSDIFHYATADAEPLPLVGFKDEWDQEVIRLYDLVRGDPKWGSVCWCCFRRNRRPVGRVVERMRDDGVWSDELESLPIIK